MKVSDAPAHSRCQIITPTSVKQSVRNTSASFVSLYALRLIARDAAFFPQPHFAGWIPVHAIPQPQKNAVWIPPSHKFDQYAGQTANFAVAVAVAELTCTAIQSAFPPA